MDFDKSNKKHPFSMSFVFSTTVKHILKAIDFSLVKTGARLQGLTDSDEDNKLRTDVIFCSANLHKLRKMITDFQLANPKLFNKKITDKEEIE